MDIRVSNEWELGRVPAKGTNAELNDGELLRWVFHLQVPDVGAIELEGLAPRRARNAAHLQVYGNEIRRRHVAAKLGESRVEVMLRHVLQRERG